MLSVLLIGISLSMDAFAVSVSNALSMRPFRRVYALWMGLYFGAFQFAMPVAGYLLGSTVAGHLTAAGGYVSFALLTVIGLKMIVETFRHEEDAGSGSIGHARLALLAVATSIDALAVGVSFAFSPPGMPLIAACALIGLVTFCLCVGGALLAGRLRSLDARWAGRIGGLVLIGIGGRILIDTIL